MTSSQPHIDRLELDTDTDSDLNQSSGVRQSSNHPKPRELGKGCESYNDSLPDHRLPTPSETELWVLTPTTTSRQLTPSSDMIVVTPSGIPINRQSTLPLTELQDPSKDEDRRPKYKNNEVSANMSKDLILTNCRRHYRRVYLSALQEPEKLQAYSAAFASSLKYPHRN